MKRWWKLLLAVTLVLGLVLAGLYWWQRENLKAVKDAVSYTSEELEEKLTENQQAIRDAVESAPEVVVREVTEEERQALRDGSLTQEELTDRLVTPAEQSGQQVPAKAEQTPQAPAETTPTPPAEQPKPAEDAYQKELSAIVAKVYVLREEYTITLDNMYEAAKAEYIAMPEAQRTKSNLAKMAGRYLDEATDLEKECDSRMDAIVAEMEKLIRENKGDMSLVDTVVYTYANEKSLKKSWYLSKLEERGLI